ncbi:MAG: glycerol-3-phosphate 1-O-acyltransferase PlsB [Pseudomonadales bacterium]|nr:glycerol-3-phosphate 1-O-acyltransferase PlsB [Pseudomonadales bacterium]MCP5182818.1 glycerol-3-phosphate 1-O-acyltransferase PlsB [Pseudomonadales bacterium]
MSSDGGLRYRLTRWLLGKLVVPRVAGFESLSGHETVYVLQNRSVTDTALLSLACAQAALPDPLSSLPLGDVTEAHRYFFLNRATGWQQRQTMRSHSEFMRRLLANPAAMSSDALIVPVCILWSRAPAREHSFWRLLVSEAWAVTSRFKRLLNILMNRRGISLQFGDPLPLCQAADPELPDGVRLRRLARLMRVRLRNERIAALGPDLSHRRTLVEQIAGARAVQSVITRQAAGDVGKAAALRRRAHGIARTIASDMSYPTIRVLERLLTWFWTRIYDGVEITGMENVTAVAASSTLVYVPCHRSHLDYLLLSYLLFHRNLMLPHIAAGDNLNIPVLGSVLRRGGAFFMRRRFAEDDLYRTVFSEYLYQVYRRGYSVEYFPEGGRSRTGRLLPPRTGLLRMTLTDQARGLPKGITFVPVYISYEKLVEAASYLDELRGAAKRGESMSDVFRGLRLIRQNFGKVQVRFGQPLRLTDWLLEHNRQQGEAALAQQLAVELMERINAAVHVNAVNLVALVLLATPRLAIEASVLNEQIALHSALMRRAGYDVVEWHNEDSLQHVAGLQLVELETQDFGSVVSAGAVAAILLTWYRNNVAHTLSLPSLIACLLVNRRRPLAPDSLASVVDAIHPYLATELALPVHSPSLDSVLAHMCELGIVLRTAEGALEPPREDTADHQRLHLLAQVVMPSLERFYIVLGLLNREDQPLNRRSLQERSRAVAKRMSRLYGLNAPEFFDAGLFNQFVDQMLKRDALREDMDGNLRPAESTRQIARAAGTVIDPDFLRAVRRG